VRLQYFHPILHLRKLAGVATRESEERFRALCNGSKQGVLVHRNHKILYVNQELADMYGYKTVGDVLLVKNSLAFLPKIRQKMPPNTINTCLMVAKFLKV
jgi:PAS domain-containing protein